jgi:rare lipoprotein A
MNHKLLSLVTTIFAVGTTVAVDTSSTRAVPVNLETELDRNNKQVPTEEKVSENTVSETNFKKRNLIQPFRQLKQNNDRKNRQLAKIYLHKVNGYKAATLSIRSIPVLTFLEPKKLEKSDRDSDLVDALKEKKIEKVAKENEPLLRAKSVALQLTKFERKGFKAEDIKVRWNPNNEDYTIKVKDREIVAINDRTILPDTTKNTAEDALQATNRLRRLMGNAPPLKDIVNLPRQIQARVEKMPSARVIREIFGQASWYGPGFHGRTTANGERYNQHGLTAAHKSLPFGTRIKVTNKNNGRTVVVRVNDRGPYAGGRVIDLSAGAASILGMMGSGVAPVQLEILGS